MSDERKPDWYGPKSTSDAGYEAHKRVYDAATDLLNGRVTHAGARKELRKALDVAERDAPKPGPTL